MRFFVALLLILSSRCFALEFYVSPTGSDSASGAIEAPFATISAAQAAARSALKMNPNESIVVYLRGGIYFLNEPIVLTPEDSGTPPAPITYTAYGDEEPIISGGMRVNGWQRSCRGWWEANIPDVANGKWSFSQLFVNGERRPRPRLPKDGYYHIERELPPQGEKDWARVDKFGYREGDINPTWSNLNEIEVTVFQSWSAANMRVSSIEEDKRIVNLTGASLGNTWFAGLPKGNRYLVENVREALGDSGEWYLDRSSGKLTYIPKSGERISTTEIIAPRLRHLLVIQGNIEAREWVHDIHFKGITFAHSNWVVPPEGCNYSQGETLAPGAITAIGGRRIVFDDCDIRHIGAYAIDIAAGCKFIRVENCKITDLGAGGIKIPGIGGSMVGNQPPDSTDREFLSSHNVIRNNLIAHGGRTLLSGIGVLIGSSPYNTIDHNDITDFHYTGISVVWTWGYAGSNAHHNTVSNNHIWNLGQGVLSDFAGIYTLGISPGTIISHNLIHDTRRAEYGAFGIYLDEGSSNILVEDNVVYNCESSSFMQHYGKNNLIRNNIFVGGKEAQITLARAEEHKSFTFTDNIVCWTEGILLRGEWTNAEYSIDNNLYYNPTGAGIVFNSQSFESWQKNGNDRNSINADPGFIDLENADFRLNADSPAFNIGFKPIIMSGFGRMGDYKPDRGRWPRVYPDRPSNVDIYQGFDDVYVGSEPPGASDFREGKGASTRVTDETAAVGKQSLKLTDAGDLEYVFDPGVSYKTDIVGGTVRISFYVRLEPGANFYFECRDEMNPYHAGSNIAIDGDGKVFSGGFERTKIPHNEWVKINIHVYLSGSGRGTFDLTVGVPGKPAQSFRKCPSDADFKWLRRLVFHVMNDGPAVYYIDELKLSR